MPLSRQQRATLRREGFLPSEVKAYSEAKASDGSPQDFQFDSKTFQSTRRSRKQYVGDLLNRGWTKAEVASRIKSYYTTRGDRSPFSWLKLEYEPAKVVSDTMADMKRKIRAKVDRTMGKAYGRRISASLRPRFLPRKRGGLTR